MNVTLRLRGDQIGSYDTLSGTGNNADRVVTLGGVEALGSSSDVFTVFVEQVPDDGTQFANGQFVTVFDSDGNIVVPRTGINPDAEQGQAAGDEHLILTQQSFVIDIGGVPAGPETVQYTQADQIAAPNVGDDDGNLDFAAFPCLVAGTQVITQTGQISVEDLTPGMRIPDYNGALRTVLWVGKRTVQLTPHDDSQRPICFEIGSLGEGLPSAPLSVSPGHRMHVTGAVPAALFGVEEVLPVARGLIGLPKVRFMNGKRVVTYVSVLLDRHALMSANGVWTESLYPGPYSLKILGRHMRHQVRAAIPGFAERGLEAYGPPACKLLRLQEARRLAQALRAEARLDASLALVTSRQKQH